MFGRDDLHLVAEEIGDRSDRVADFDGLSSFDLCFEKAVAGGRVAGLHVSGVASWILDHIVGFKGGNLSFDHAQVGHQVEAAGRFTYDSLGAAYSASQPFRVEGGDVGIPCDGEGSSVMAGFCTPDDRDLHGSGHGSLLVEDFRIGVQAVADHGGDLHDLATAVKIDVVIGRLNESADLVGQSFGDGPVGVTGACTSEIQVVIAGPMASPEGTFVDTGNKGQFATELIRLDSADESSDGSHRFEFIAVDTAGDEQVGTVCFADDGMGLKHGWGGG